MTTVKWPQVTQQMVFPNNLETYPFWMTFQFYQYKRPAFSGGSTFTATPAGTIRLPLPNQMVDHQDVTYTPEELGLTLGASTNLQTQFNTLAGVGTFLAGKAIGADRALQSKPVGALTQLGGVAANPFLTVMFKSPSFKKHQLSWKLTPTEDSESSTLLNILSTLKFNQLPSTSGAFGGSMLAYPNIVQIQVSNSGSMRYLFKPAVIEGLTINYTPSGQPSFFGRDQTPTEVEFRLSILEIEYWLQDDYGTPTTAGANMDIRSGIGRAIGNIVQDVQTISNIFQR